MPRSLLRLIVLSALFLAGASARADDTGSLGKASRSFLDAFTRIRPGMTEAELRKHLPNLGPARQAKDRRERDGTTLDVPAFTLGGTEWTGEFYLADGKLRGARLETYNHPSKADGSEGERISRADARELKRTVMRHFADRFGAQPEILLPLLECPAGNPCTLRKTWPSPTHILAVEYSAASGTGYLEVFLWEPKDWDAWNKEQYDDLWPFKRK
jgi:hypothetical protein